MFNWRVTHLCSRFKDLDEKGRCLFCRLNEDKLMALGVEAVPFDAPEAYKDQEEPNVIIQSIRNEKTSSKPS